jgi:hypothetical protein
VGGLYRLGSFLSRPFLPASENALDLDGTGNNNGVIMVYPSRPDCKASVQETSNYALNDGSTSVTMNFVSMCLNGSSNKDSSNVPLDCCSCLSPIEKIN